MTRSCFLCEKEIFNFQSILKCTGGFCGKVVHLSCVRRFSGSFLSDRGLSLNDDGDSRHGLVFKCLECTNLVSLNEIFPENASQGLNVDDSNNSINNKHFAEILTLMKSLFGEIRTLRADNAELKRELRGLKDAISSKPSTMVNSNFSNHEINRSNKETRGSPNLAERNRQLESHTTDKSGPVNAGHSVMSPPSKSAQSEVNPAVDDSDGFIPVVNKKRKSRTVPPLHGSMKSDALKVAKRKPGNKELFVSRLDPTTSTQDLEKFVLTSFNLKSLKCTKLKTKYVSYASFHLLIDSEDFNKIHHEDLWPEGVLVKPFLGRLRVSESKNEVKQPA